MLDVCNDFLTKIENVLDDDNAYCDSLTGWGVNNCSLSLNTSETHEGDSCFKMTLTNTTGNFFKDFLSELDTSKYYLFTAHLKNSDLTTIQMDINVVGGLGITYGTTVSGTSYTRVGTVIQPSDFVGATNCYISFYAKGSIGEIAYVDSISINEISAYEYSLGASTILQSYPFLTNNLYIHDVPDTPNNLIGFRYAGGVNPNQTLGEYILNTPTYENPTIQAYIRNTSCLNALEWVENIKKAFDGVINRTINNNLYINIFQSSDILPLNRDDRNRWIFTINFEVKVKRT